MVFLNWRWNDNTLPSQIRVYLVLSRRWGVPAPLWLFSINETFGVTDGCCTYFKFVLSNTLMKRLKIGGQWHYNLTNCFSYAILFSSEIRHGTLRVPWTGSRQLSFHGYFDKVIDMVRACTGAWKTYMSPRKDAECQVNHKPIYKRVGSSKSVRYTDWRPRSASPTYSQVMVKRRTLVWCFLVQESDFWSPEAR